MRSLLFAANWKMQVDPAEARGYAERFLGSTATALGLTGTEQSLLPTLGTGEGLWRIKHRSFVVKHQLHPAELELFDTTGRMNTAAPRHLPSETTPDGGTP